MTVILEQLFRGFLAPAVVWAAVLALFRARRSSGDQASAAALGAAAATASGYIVGHGLLVGWAFFDPVEKKDWLPLVCVVVAAAVAAEGASALRRAGARRGLFVLVSALAVWLIVRPSHGLVLTGTILAAAGLWIAVESLARRRPGPGPASTSFIALVAASAVLVLSGSASFGQLTGVVAACAAMLAIAAWRRPELPFLRGASGITVLVPAALWLNLHRTSYTEVPVSSALLVGAAMLSGWIPEAAAIRRLGPRARAAVYLFASIVPAAAAVLVAWSVAEPAGEYDY